MQDEPMLGQHPGSIRDAQQVTDELTSHKIRSLLISQPFAVLCTQGKSQPYGSLVAFAASDDLTSAVFATPVTTRKYHLLTACDRVALMVDNRCQHPDDMMNVEAITATGRAMRVMSGPGFERWSQLLVNRHPYLKPFVVSPSVALFRVDVYRFFYVTHFQEVFQWKPTSTNG